MRGSNTLPVDGTFPSILPITGQGGDIDEPGNTEPNRRPNDGAAPRPDALSVLSLARKRFIQGRRIDMGELGADLGVSRATLFRWVGNRDQLTADILRDLATKTFRDAQAAHADTTGARRVSAVVGDFVQTLSEARFFVDFVHREPERALRLLTTKESPVQGYVIGRVEQLLDEEIDPASGPGEIRHHDLAYLIVRICESLLYTDLITGEPPNPDIARQAIYALIR